MSVLVEAISVIVPIVMVNAKYPGGVDQYSRDCPNKTFCADEHLTRVGFMAPADVRPFVEQLESLGFVHVRDGLAVELVVIDQFQGPTCQCTWIQAGKHPDGYSAAWLAETVPGWFEHPAGWTPEQSRKMQFSPNAEVEGRFLHLGKTGVSDVLLDYQTGKQVYMGRVRREAIPGDDAK